MTIGAELSRGEAGVHVRVWAPTHRRVTLVIEAPERREIVLGAEAGGYHGGFAPSLAAGARYRFRFGDDAELHADPASRFQPEGPFGPSEVIDASAFAWSDATWRGIPPHKHVLYEMHIGTFTPEGTWAAAAEQLEFLAAVGITTLEVMPINEFAGSRNWGYDGVNLFAPTHNYGRPDDMRRFVDRAHACGLAVILDVVYNHFGPAGNSMFTVSPHFRGGAGEWGDEINFDGADSAGVREFFIANAGYWIEEMHLDGLRLDATQAIHDSSKEHVLAAIARRVREAGRGRQIFLVGENEPQDCALFDYGLDALWNDDYHHSVLVAATGTTDGYLHDYRGTPQELVSAIKYGFLYQGQLYPWQQNPRGTPTRGRERHRFVHFLENHDQVANVGFGERLGDLADPALVRALTALTLLGPALPMLFQGQEVGARQPWLFFVDHPDDLKEPVRKGRKEFLSQFARLATPGAQERLADPCDEATFRSCILDPAARKLDDPTVMLHRDLLRLRREDPAFTSGDLDGSVLGDHAFCLRFFVDGGGADRLLLVNLGPTFTQVVVPEPLIAPPLGHGWSVLWSSEDPAYGGHGTAEPINRARVAIPAHSAVVMVPDPTINLRIAPAPPSGKIEV